MVTDSPKKSKSLAFSERLRKRARQIDSWLCVGIDPDPEKLPAGVARDAEGVVEFSRQIIEATQRSAACFKMQLAFFEMLGPSGWEALFRVRESIPREIPVIADAKRGDIANSARAYATALFDELGFDGVTVNPYLGWDAIEPFLSREGKAAFVLCRTSNPGAIDLQELQADGEQLYMRVARSSLELKSAGEVGLVVGATAPEALLAVRGLSEDVVLLVPGVGTQGGSLEEAFARGATSAGENALINVSREILFASSRSDYAQAATSASEAVVKRMRSAGVQSGAIRDL